jgi:hypothetical protein
MAGSRIVTESHRAGTLVLPSGILAPCDPLAIKGIRQLVCAGGAAQYDVILSIAHVQGVPTPRVASAMLRIADTPACVWETVTCHEVISQVSCFLDAGAAQLLLADQELYAEVIQALNAQRNTGAPRGWWCANVQLDAATGANLIAFSAGWSSGVQICRSAGGYDANGNLVCVMTTFSFL